MDGMHTKMDSIVRNLNKLGEECNLQIIINYVVITTKDDAQALSKYTEEDRFSAVDFERNIDRNLKQAKIAWQENQAKVLASFNEGLKDKYQGLFNDPSRFPHFDEKVGVWNLSSKFMVQENDAPDFIAEREPLFKHPFLEKML